MEGIATAAHLNNPKTVRAWYMYDWANSVYTLVITTAIFPIYYKAIAVDSGSDRSDNHKPVSSNGHSERLISDINTSFYFYAKV